MTTQKTYWHLEKYGKIPSQYDIATSHLLPYYERGFAVNVSVKTWYDQFQKNSLFQCRNWECFADPRQTTYSSYVELQKNNELYVDKIFNIIEYSDYDQQLNPNWVFALEVYLPPLRFLFHGLQMVAAYIGQMAPASRVTMVASFQAADEMRRIQRIAYRMRLLQHTYSTFGMESKVQWETAPLWQPLRKLIEELLVTFDWGEALIALNFVVKPALDRLFVVKLAEYGKKNGDYQLSNILLSLNEDCLWHQKWSQDLLDLVVEGKPDLKKIINEWTENWHIKVKAACLPFTEISEP
jgi:toluene monooxygenase system protein E